MRTKCFIFILSFLIPVLSLAESGKRTFYVGRSYFFLLLLASVVYVFYLYQNNKDKKKIFESPFNLTLCLTSVSLFLSYLFINIFFTEPVLHKAEKFEHTLSIAELLDLDHRNFEKAEHNFTEAEMQYQYISDHFLIPPKWGDSTPTYRDDLTLQNFYYDRLNFGDSLYVNIARLSLGLFYYKTDSIEKALGFFKQIHSYKFPYLNYYTASAYLKLKDTTNAISYLQKAIHTRDSYQDDSYMSLITIQESRNDDHALFKLLEDPVGGKYIHQKLAIKLYFKQHRILTYYKTVLIHAFRDFQLTGGLAAFIILLVWVFFIIRIDVFDQEKMVSIGLTLVTGMLFSFLAFYLYDFMEIRGGYKMTGNYWNDLWYCILGIGGIEEFVKIIPLLCIIIFAPKLLDEAYDYILFASISALGFAFIENLFYFHGDLAGIIQGRAMTSVPGHMIDSSIVAYGFVLSRFRYKNFPWYIGFPVFFFLGMLGHGLYDYWLFVHAFSFFLLHFLISVSIWVILINNCLNNSPHFTYKIKLGSKNLQTYMALTFIGVYMLEYFLVAWEAGPSFANDSFNTTLVLGGIFIVYYTHKLTNMDLVKGYWNGISFTSIANKRNNEKFHIMVFLGRLIFGDIVPHSLVNSKVFLCPDFTNTALSQFLIREHKADITDRVVVTCKSKIDGMAYKDPYWFMLKTEIAFNPGTVLSENIFLFRFKEERPSFETGISHEIYLFSFKNGAKQHHGEIIREDLRALGKALLKM